MVQVQAAIQGQMEVTETKVRASSTYQFEMLIDRNIPQEGVI